MLTNLLLSLILVALIGVIVLLGDILHVLVD